MKVAIQPKRVVLWLTVLCCFSFIQARAQSISGTVVSSENSKPLEGVSVSFGQKRGGTTTDAEGHYRLQAAKGDGKLVFSYTGYGTQEVSIGDRTVINISLVINSRDLSEVVVTAFGIEKQKRSIGYSTQVVKGDELTVARETNVASSLKGKVAGVFVSPSNTGDGGSTFVNIRGASSFLGNNQPLYVVDGVPIDNQTIDMPDLNNDIGSSRDYGDGIGNILPDDIETITVLKGPNAAALYGSRGAKGVILITTKKGKPGKNAVIDFNSNSVFERPNILPVYQNVWGPGYSQNTDGWNTDNVNGQQVLELPNWTGGDTWGPKYDGRPIVLQEWPDAGVLKFSPQPSDELSKFYRTGSTFTNTIGVSGGNEKGNYRLSISDLHNQGIYPTSQLDRQTVNLRVGFNATPKLYIEGKINYIRQ
ncbi:MAG TPA: TonB-dependent receptor plug domain-containing protein, partial [Puia sp.]